MATKKELYELLSDMGNCLDELNKIFKTKSYSLEYNDEKIIYRTFKEYPNGNKTTFESEVDISDALHPEGFEILQGILETFKKACKDLTDTKEFYARLNPRISKEGNLCRE